MCLGSVSKNTKASKRAAAQKRKEELRQQKRDEELRLERKRLIERNYALSRSDRNSIIVAILALLPLFYLLLFYRPDTLSSAKVIGKLTSSDSLKRRHSRSLYWAALREGEVVYLRDIVYTPRDTTAVFILNGNQRIEIEPDSMVQFDEVTLDAINITLYGGSVKGFGINLNERDPLKLKPYRAGKLLPYLPDVEPFELRSSEFTDRLSKRLRRKLPLQEVKDLQQPELPLNAIEYYSIYLIRPKPNDVLPLGRDTWVDTLWTPIPLAGVRYEINISKEKNFTQSITHETDINGLELLFRDESAYYWQVRAFVDGSEVRSRVRRFVMSKQGVPIFERLPARDELTGNIQEIAKDRDFKRIVSSIVADGKKCSPLTLKRGVYWCRVWNLDRTKQLNFYRMTVK